MKKKLKNLLHFAVVLLFSLPLALKAQETVSIGTLQDIPPLVQNYNYDLKLLEEDIRRAQASLLNLQGQYYYPELKTEINFEDNNQEPVNPFQPARIRDFFWEVKTEQKLPQGISTEFGVSSLNSRVFQSDPPNPLLPFPQTFNQPVLFLRVSVDILQDFLGYITRKELQVSSLDYDTSVVRSVLFRHKMTVAAGTLFLQIVNLKSQKALRYGIIRAFSRLRGDIQRQLNRSLGEAGDLARVNRLIATAQADVIRLEKNRDVIIRNLQSILGISVNSQVVPEIRSQKLLKQTRKCEDRVLTTEFNASLSQEFELLAMEKNKGKLNSKIFRRQRLPDISLEGGVASTGTDPDLGGSFKEVGVFDRPIYSVGLKFSWPLSPKRLRAAKEASVAAAQTPSIEFDKIFHERKILWKRTQDNIQNLRKEYAKMIQAVRSGEKEVADLLKRFDQGRLTFFELSEVKVEVFRLKVLAEALKFQRTQNLLETLQLFNKFECPLIPDWHP